MQNNDGTQSYASSSSYRAYQDIKHANHWLGPETTGLSYVGYMTNPTDEELEKTNGLLNQ